MSRWRPAVDRGVLLRRARLLGAIREFFSQRAVIEVDTPTLSAAAVSDPNIHSLQTRIEGVERPRYLHTSPEFSMKRLLAGGSGDIYQICKVFRQGEVGRNHNPEFSMLEWYRLGFDHHRLMDEMAALLGSIVPELGTEPPLRIAYHDAFKRYAKLDVEADIDSIRQCIDSRGVRPPDGLTDKTEYLDWVIGVFVAPQFPRDRFTFLYDYPAEQAALARVRSGSPSVAERFEVFWGELELANGFHELADADEQLQRFSGECEARAVRGLHVPPIDQNLIDALRHGLPDCAGVALGIDRLLMACLGKASISEVIAFDLHNA